MIATAPILIIDFTGLADGDVLVYDGTNKKWIVEAPDMVDGAPAKADKVVGATAGHLAGLDSSGNLTDSGFDNTSFLHIDGSTPMQGDLDLDGNNISNVSSLTTETLSATGFATLADGASFGGSNITNISQITAATAIFSGTISTPTIAPNIVSGAGTQLTLAGGASSASSGADVVAKGGIGTSTSGSVRLETPTGTTKVQVNATGVGFFNVTPVAQQSGNLIVALSNLGLVTNAGAVTFAPVSTSTTGFSTTISGGASSGAAQVAGAIAINGGANSLGTGGAATLAGGSGSGGNGGNAIVQGGSSANTGGSSIIKGGTGTPNGPALIQTAAGVTKIQVDDSGVGFFGGSTVAQQTGNIATALSNLGLVTSPALIAATLGALTDAGVAGKLGFFGTSLYCHDGTAWRRATAQYTGTAF